MAYAESLDSLVLGAMCEEPGPWTREELTREFREGVAAIDSLNRLLGRGLVTEVKEGFYAATAAGRYAHEVGTVGQ